MEKKLRLGIIGVGNMGTAHGKNVLEGKCPDFVLSALCDTDGRRLEGWGGARVSKPPGAPGQRPGGRLHHCHSPL